MYNKITNSFLLVWNPKTWEWTDFEEKFKTFKSDVPTTIKWGCGKNKKISVGDQVYLIKLGQVGSQGIMASGIVIKDSFLDVHWNGVPGDFTQYVEFELDQLVHHERESDQMIDVSELDNLILGKRQEWHPQQSGISLNEEALLYLNKRWLENQYSKLSIEYSEGKVSQRTVKTYERDRKARATAIEVHGCSCSICNFSFEKTYGELGRGFIHVHHITPISSLEGKQYKIDPTKDLIPVCPNCHAMLHRTKEIRSHEEIIKLIQQNNKKNNVA